MKQLFKQINRSQSNSSHFNQQNKQNTFDCFKGQKDICKILSHFNDLIQSNKQAISSLRNEFTARATNGSLSQQNFARCFNDDQQRSYCHAPDNSMNQTYQTISKQQHSSNVIRIQCNQINALNQKFELIKHQIQDMKRSQNQNSLNLQKRFSEKGEKSQIEKVLNLSKLLVVEINQIQDRFKENQTNTRIQQDKIKFLELNLSRLNQRFSQENKLKSKSTGEDLIYHQNSTLNQALIKKLETKIQQLSKINQTKIEQLKLKTQTNAQEKYQEQFNSIYSRIVNLESHFGQIQTKRDSSMKEISLELKNLAKQIKKQGQKIKKETQVKYFNKFDSLNKLYVQKSYFLQEKQEHQTQIGKVTQNLDRIHNQLNYRIQKFEKCLQSSQITIQKHHSQLLLKLNKVSQDQSDKLVQTRQQIQKILNNKYVKTQKMKKCLQQQNQKMRHIINANLQQQKQVNKVLCSENILGRWLWQNQQLKNGNLISWDKEMINTLPQNFKFSSQKSTLIQISSGGIYKFELGFYSKKKPTIQILINGKVVMSAVNSSSYVIHHSSGKLKGIEPTEMSGLTLLDFFLIPQNSRIAIAYSGDLKGQGFINIHRL